MFDGTVVVAYLTSGWRSGTLALVGVLNCNCTGDPFCSSSLIWMQNAVPKHLLEPFWGATPH